MLKSLHISNYALISDLEIDFSTGFSVITGETGAGKSIIIGALSLILGQRADSRVIKEGEPKCFIEAYFDIKAYNLEPFFVENELDYDVDNCFIRRELTANGKSRAFVNDTPVSLTQLRDLSSRLIDIHSQHENLLLSNELYQLNVVDTIAQNSKLLAAYKDKYTDTRNLQQELAKLKKQAAQQTADLDYVRFQFQQLEEAKLVDGEQQELEQELETLSHAEEIKTELLNAGQLLLGEQMSLSLIKESVNAVNKIKDYIAGGAELAGRIQSAYIELKDIADEISGIEEHIEFNQERLERVESRLSDLYGFFKKHQVDSVAELINIRDEFDKRLQRIESFDDDVAALEKKIEVSEKELSKVSDELTKSRREAAKPIEGFLINQLSQLGMPNIRFQVEIKPLDDYTENGKDSVVFLFSSNKNKSMQPVVQIASGGEISRLMLSIKSLIANRAGLPTIIFDEIDTGVSGEIAHRMGEIMKQMSADMQVITITHLPQIAAKGNAHYKVYKDESGDHAQTFIKQLNTEERTKEIAQMLSGDQITDAAIKQAEQLLQ
ncbi:DNA repair protein RecN [Paludibacter sp. 221]|uniref:DNA repair protein RecN n=1 Tax=Paludibacter sp. 221 TaxID=2302939 RepID=UPI0013D25AEB|nr:DNA repair protein RecN [Paludibacter sp. 221]NDV47442.1 DNA repair protein RecN [Paludibacter sp. 221]